MGSLQGRQAGQREPGSPTPASFPRSPGHLIASSPHRVQLSSVWWKPLCGAFRTAAEPFIRLTYAFPRKPPENKLCEDDQHRAVQGTSSPSCGGRRGALSKETRPARLSGRCNYPERHPQGNGGWEFGVVGRRGDATSLRRAHQVTPRETEPQARSIARAVAPTK